jgi:CRISPR-associated protein Cas2
MMDVLVTYDIATINAAGERRLARVAAVCERYGVRAQYSVFECRLSPASLQTLIGELLDVMKPDEDSINIYRLERPMPEVRQSLGVRKSTLGQHWILAPRTAGDP